MACRLWAGLCWRQCDRIQHAALLQLFQPSCFDSIQTEGSFFFINWHMIIIPICNNAFTAFQYMVAINILKEDSMEAVLRGKLHGVCG